MLLELEKAGYLTRVRSKKPDGRWARYVELSDIPVPVHRGPTIDGSAVDGSATDGSAVDGSGVDLLNTLNNSRGDKLRTTTTKEPKANGKRGSGSAGDGLEYPGHPERRVP